MPRTLFVTTALPYANGPFHIGHIMEYIQADIWVRFQRMQGHAVHFMGADDAHGAPIMLKAEAEGVSPRELVARIGAERPKYLQGFHISFDNWHSTDSPENVELSQDIYRKLKAAGLIYAKRIEQFYDPVKGMFLAPFLQALRPGVQAVPEGVAGRAGAFAAAGGEQGEGVARGHGPGR
jgi:methionyl-tRNA synthetase